MYNTLSNASCDSLEDGRRNGRHFPSGPVGNMACQVLQLPHELLSIVFDHLSPSDIASLALTCHALQNIIKIPEPVRTRCKSRKAFLDSLQRDLPDHFQCRNCDKFHRTIRSSGTQRIANAGCDGYPCDDRIFGHGEAPLNKLHAAPQTIYYGQHYFLSFTHAQLVIDRYYLSPNHGVPLDYIAFSAASLFNCGLEQSWHGPKEDPYLVEESFRPKIVNGQLLLGITYRWLMADIQTVAPLMLFVNSSYKLICRHLTINRGSPSQWVPYQIPEMDYFECGAVCSSSKQGCVERQAYGGCGYCKCCPTDYEVDIREVYDQEWQVSVRAWQDLGPCRDARDPYWKALLGYWENQLHCPGNIKELYENAGD